MSDHAQELSEEDETKLRQAFDFYKDEDDQLHDSQLRTVCQCFGFNPTTKEMDDEMAKANVNSDEKMSYEVVRRFVINNGGMDRESSRDIMEDSINTTFEKLDKDKSGAINRDEFREFLQNCGGERLSNDDVDEMFNEFDSNDDNVISREELMAFGRKMTSA